MPALDQALGDLKPAHARQVQVAQHHVGPQLADHRHRGLAAVGFADHFDVGFA
jgi:hypothetical protein